MTFSGLLPRIDSRERGRFYPAALAFMCVATSALIARAVGDSLFLSRLGSDPLPLMYILGALVTGLGSYACAAAAPRVATARIGVLVAAALIAANLGVYLTLGSLPVVSRATAYLLADISGRIPVILYWAFVIEVFDAGESRRLFGLLGAMGTAACLPAGLLVGPFARRFGLSALILVVCFLLAGSILASRALQRRAGGDRPAGEPGLTAANRQSAGQLHRKRQFTTIAALALVTSLVQTLVDYQFKAAFAPRASGAALAAIFGQLYAYASLAALFLQLFLVHRILRSGGVLVSLSALPASLLAASALVLQTVSAGWVYATKTLDITLTLTVNGTARQMLYRGIRSESRLQARALAEGLYPPAAVAIAGSILAFTIDSLTIRIIAGITIAGCVVWLLVARAAYASYVAGLLSSLRAARLEADDRAFAAREPAVRRYVMDTMTSGTNEEVKYLAAVLPNVLPLAEHPDPEVRWTVVRAAAAGEFPTEKHWFRAKLSDSDPRVRAFAAAGLINSGSGAAATEGKAHLEELAASESVAERLAAAEGLGEVRKGGVTSLLETLLHSREQEVLEAALEACPAHADPALIPAILPLLTTRRVAAEASDALVAIGASAIVPVARFLRKSSRLHRAEAVKKLARALGRHGDFAALPLLDRLFRMVGPEDREPLFQAWADLVRGRKSAGDSEAIQVLVLSEAREAMARLTALRQLGCSPASQLLRVALTYVATCHIHHAFILLDVLTREVDMIALYASFIRGSRESRSQVVELLHNVLPESLQSPLLEALGEVEREPEDEGSDERRIVALTLEERASEWVAAGALYAASRLDIRPRRQDMTRFLRHPNPIVRETALAAITRDADRAAFLEDTRSLTIDADATVRKLAKSFSWAAVNLE